MKLRTFLLPAFACLLAAPCRADKDAKFKPVIASAGSAIAEDSFASGQLDKSWVAAKGDWQVVDGVLVGKEKPEDKHAAVLTLSKPNHDSIIQFSFKLDGASRFELSYNHAKGHLFRVAFAPTGITIRTDGDKKDKSIKAEEVGRASGKLEAGKWISAMVEVKGTKISVQTDTGLKAEGSHPRLDVGKTGYRFIVGGASVSIDDVKASEAK